MPKPITATRPILYSGISINGVPIPRDKIRISGNKAADLLGWEEESKYKERLVKENPNLKKNVNASFDDDFLLRDLNGEKVRCWNNPRNRPFTEGHARELAQSILTGDYRFNCENIIISTTGIVTSGQHRLVGLKLAIQMWYRDPSKFPYWKEEPYIESLVAFGGSEDPKVLMTLDNVRPRSESDVIYTSDLFLKLSSVDRKECSRMLAAAVDLVWRRARIGDIGGIEWSKGRVQRYQTHSESLKFLDGHPRLLQCVKHLFEENRDRGIAKLRLSSGQCAGMMFFQASAKSSRPDYLANPTEKALDWSLWDRAKEFWASLSAEPVLLGVREAIGGLVDDGGGRLVEKIATLSKAWRLFLQGQKVTKEALALSYSEEGGVMVLNEADETFGGIDVGEELVPSAEEVQEEKKRIREERAEELAKAKESKNGKGPEGGAATPIPATSSGGKPQPKKKG